jgi:PAS domain S-box-containing protein
MGEYAEVCELASVLRDIADERGLTVRALSDRMPYGHTKISQSLNGAKRPEWGFIQAFLTACAGRDRRALSVLVRKVRPLWEAAAPGRARPLAETAVVADGHALAVVPEEVRGWVACLHDAASTQLVVAQLQSWVVKHENLAGGLQHILEQLTAAVAELQLRRRTLFAEVRAAVTDEVSALRAELADTRQRLTVALDLQASTAQRLDRALQQRQEGLELLHQAQVQADQARQKLVELEERALSEPREELELAEAGTAALMGQVDQAIAAEVLDHVDGVLREGSDTFDLLRGEVRDAAPPGDRATGHLSADIAVISADITDDGSLGEWRYRSLLEATSQVGWTASPAGEMIDGPPEWRVIFGQAAELGTDARWFVAVHPDDRPDVEILWNRCLQEASLFSTQCRMGVRAGGFRYFEVRAAPIVRAGQVTEWVAAHTDVTGQREAEEMRGRLTEQLSAAALRTARLQQVSSMLARALTVSQVVQVITEVGRSAIGAEYSAVALLDYDTVWLRLVPPLSVTEGRGEGSLAFRNCFRISDQTVLSVAARESRPFIAEHPDGLRVQLGASAAESILQQTDERAWVGLPLLTAGAPIGALRFSFTRPREITEEERVFLEALAGQCALAVERALLFEREHKTAEELQRSLLPSALPQLPGMVLAARYKPATRHVQVGGDWYDVFRLPDDRLAVAVGDVMGKGVLAVAGMGRVRNALRALAFSASEPAAVFAGLDAMFTATEDEEQCATLIYAVLDPATARGTISNAGYPPPLLISPTQAPAFGGPGPGTPLGWPSPREETTICIPPGHTLVFYSDGLLTTRKRGLDTGMHAGDERPNVAHQLPGRTAAHR